LKAVLYGYKQTTETTSAMLRPVNHFIPILTLVAIQGLKIGFRVDSVFNKLREYW
jgi:hypothetical protein